MNKLNLGAGLTWPSGWVNVDKYPASENIVEADVLKGLPFPDNHFDFVLMNHTLQVFTYNELPTVLAEVHRVMKPGAELRILTPDLFKAVMAVTNYDAGYFPIADDIEATTWGKFARYIFWHGETRCAFTHDSLQELLTKCGFKNVNRGTFGGCELDSRKDESLIIVCKK